MTRHYASLSCVMVLIGVHVGISPVRIDVVLHERIIVWIYEQDAQNVRTFLCSITVSDIDSMSDILKAGGVCCASLTSEPSLRLYTITCVIARDKGRQELEFSPEINSWSKQEPSPLRAT